MLHNIAKSLDKMMAVESASAHCDIPCGIYDPATAQLATLTVIRILDLIAEIGAKDELTIADHAKLSRLVAQKEEHVQEVKNAVRVIWGDYFKQPQFDAHPEIHDVTHGIMLAASKCSQGVEVASGEALLTEVNKFAEIFWATKGVATKVATCPYAPAKDVVYPAL